MFSIYIYTQSTTRPMFGVASLMRLVGCVCLQPTADDRDEFLSEVCSGIAFSHSTLGL